MCKVKIGGILLMVVVSLLFIYVLDGIFRDWHYTETGEELEPILLEIWDDGK